MLTVRASPGGTCTYVIKADVPDYIKMPLAKVHKQLQLRSLPTGLSSANES